MGTEIERKFLLKNDSWRSISAGEQYKQGYLLAGTGTVVRVRIAGEQSFLTIKGKYKGFSRPEFEYPIPGEDALYMLEHLCIRPLIEKVRYKASYGGFTWEIDEFEGVNKGLILAEIELDNEDQQFALPDWIGEEVTGDPRYSNSNLVINPYTKWQ